jgi:phage-related protein
LNYFVLDNSINSRADLGLRITQPPSPPATKRIVEAITVDGREGSLTIRKGWEDISFDMRAALLGVNIPSRWRTALPKLLNAKTVYFSSDPTVYYNIKHAEAGALERRLSSLFDFPVTFTCAPFRYLRNVAPVTMTATGSLSNPGTVYSLPKITVFGTGSRNLTINGKLIVLNILSGSLVLDSELKTCYYGSVAQNQNMNGDFPVLNVGSNTITLGTGITKIEIEPRWRYI